MRRWCVGIAIQRKAKGRGNIEYMIQDKIVLISDKLNAILKSEYLSFAEVAALKNITGVYLIFNGVDELLCIGNTNKFQIDFLIEQKKTFEFKNKKLSIGGDLCYTDNILLNGKSYMVFLNVDEMGKYLQEDVVSLIIGSILGATI